VAFGFRGSTMLGEVGGWGAVAWGRSETDMILVVFKWCGRVSRKKKDCSVLQVKIAGSLEVGVAGFICPRGRLLCRNTRRVRS
jgi:hypothetical protein